MSYIRYRYCKTQLRPPCVPSELRSSLQEAATPATDSPSLASRVVGQCFYSDAGASGGKTLISRINLFPSATCRALRACLLTVPDAIYHPLSRTPNHLLHRRAKE